MKKEYNKGITLIALVITIIILLILSSIIIATLTGENGLLKKATDAMNQTKKQQYLEEIKLEIMEEQMQRKEIKKEEAFIRSIYDRLMGNAQKEKKTWIHHATMYNEEYVTQTNDNDNTLLVVETIEGYDIFIHVDNEKLNTSIEEIYEIEQNYPVIFDANTGTGYMDTYDIRAGGLCTLPTNKFSKENYSFVGWCQDPEGNGKIYTEGSKIKITQQTTIYAIWKEIELITITFNANGGNGTMEPLKVTPNTKKILPANTFSKSGYSFSKWNTKPDGTGTTYLNNSEITTENTDITLYALWTIPLYIYNNGSISSYPMVSKSYSSPIISLGTNTISYNSGTNSYLYCSTVIPNAYNTLHVSIKATASLASWAACRVGVRPTYGSDGTSSFSSWFIPTDWYATGMAASPSQANDSTYRDYTLSLTGINASSYYFFLHTAGMNWSINKIWFE